MKPKTDRQTPHSKPKNIKKTLKRLLSYTKEHTFSIILAMLLVMISSFATVIGSYLLKPIINNYIIPLIGQKNPSFTKILQTLIFMAVVYGTGALCSYFNSYIMIKVTSSTLFKVRTQLFEHMEKLPVKFFDSKTHGEVMSLYTNDTDTLREFMNQVLPHFLSSVITLISVFIMMLILSPLLTLLVLVSVGLMIFLTKVVTSHSHKAFKEQQEALAKVNGCIEEMTEGQRVVKVFCREKEAANDFSKLNNKLCDAGTRAQTFGNILGPLMNNLSHITYACTAMAGAFIVIAGKMDVGSIAVFLQYTRNFSQPIGMLSQQFNSILNALAGAERIFAMLDEKAEIDSGTKLLSFDEKKSQGKIVFDSVNFGYRKDKQILHNISFVAEQGKKIALVGSTGSGKTTIINLLTRFYDIDSGTITFDGIPIDDISKDSLRSNLGMVLQDTHLFSGTIMENIRYGKLDATDEDVYNAAKLANADSFINHLPEGYKTVISGDGTNLSQGQRQLLAIARAAISSPSVLILDEATSSIDTRTERLIETGMDRLMKNRTTFVIAHRLSTVRNADLILVMEKGSIIERGNHEELLLQKGRYYDLYTGMFELN